MIQTETEDMLPRSAPKPSTPSGEQLVRPTVPEVSLLFGQQASPNQQQQHQMMQSNPQTKQPTYSSWKKQMLPRVSFPETLATELGPGSSSNTTTQFSSACATSSTNTVNSAVTSSEYDYERQPRASVVHTPPIETTPTFVGNTNVGYSDTLEQYRRSYSHRFAGPQGIGIVSANRAAPLTQRRSLDVGIASRTSSDVLTICAGTQTEPVNISPQRGTSRMDIDDVATKEDIATIHGMLQLVREEQLRLLHYCESLFSQQSQQVASKSLPKTCLKEIGTQCELLTSNNAPNNLKRSTPIAYEYIPEETDEEQPPKVLQAAPSTYNQLKTVTQFQSPRAPPAAQSTAYRPNTPQAQAKRLPMASANVATVLPKPNTEKSLVMNELALKYLPQEKLAELMQELRMSTPANNEIPPQPMSPLRQIENYDKSPNDISNASYKYLKKYRLLPEEHNGYVQQGLSSPQRHELQQSPLSSRKPHSPYQQYINSPLIGGNHASPVLRVEQNMLDLENIRNQPKLL